MRSPISNQVPTRVTHAPLDGADLRERASAAAGAFRRSAPPASAAQDGRRIHAGLSEMRLRPTGEQRLGALGAEIQYLYAKKIVGNERRSFEFADAKGEKCTVQGADVDHLVIHTKNGLIDLGRAGRPTPNAVLPLRNRDAAESTLRNARDALRTAQIAPPKVRISELGEVGRPFRRPDPMPNAQMIDYRGPGGSRHPMLQNYRGAGGLPHPELAGF